MIGPEVPKEILEKKRQSQQHESSHDDEPSSPSHPPPDEDNDTSAEVSVGPVIPPEVLARKRQQQQHEDEQSAPQEEEEEDDDADAYAPALPPDLLQERQKRNQPQQPQQQQQRRRRAPVGPALPSVHDDDDDDVVGPVLPANYNPQEASVRSAIEDIEERARKSREAMEESRAGAKSDKVERPEWMLLPPEIDYLRGADSSRSRGFNTSSLTAKERDRSVWTDTPADRERKRKDRDGGDRDPHKSGGHTSQYDRETRRNIEQYNATKRSKTLMEIHKEMGGRKRTEEEDATSRPFDREKDFLNAPRRKVDRHQRDEMLKRAGELGSRFGSSGTSFL